MVRRAPLTISLVLIATMIVMSAIAWRLVPPDHIAVHFDADGHPNGFAPRWFALWITPTAAALLTFFFWLIPSLPGSSGNRLLPRMQAYIAGWIGTILVLGACHALIVLQARGILLNVAGNVSFIVALLLMVVGNFLGKVTPNRYVGVRTPWTYKSNYSWQKTNRLGGWMLVGVGAATLVTVTLTGPRIAIQVLIFGVLGFAFASFALSWYYWKTDPGGAP